MSGGTQRRKVTIKLWVESNEEDGPSREESQHHRHQLKDEPKDHGKFGKEALNARIGILPSLEEEDNTMQ